MQGRQERLAALNGESRVFVCHSCGRVKHVKDAKARTGRTGGILCRTCVVADIINYRLNKAARAMLYELPFTPRQVDMVFTMPGAVREINFTISWEDIA